MKKTLLTSYPGDLPEEMRRFADGAKLYDSSCSPAARVYFIDRGAGYYLKCAGKGTLEREAKMTEYFHKKGVGAEVLCYLSDKCDWFLTAAVPGEDCTAECYLAEPRRLCDTFAYALRNLHEMPCGDCPVTDRTAEYLATVEENFRTGNYDSSQFPDSFGYRSAEEAYGVFTEGKSALQSNVLIHGDYCLPNILLNNWKFSGFIDIGNGGIGDRHIDLFWGIWTLGFNLKTDAYRTRFLDAYGRDKVDEPLLKVISAAEVFG